VDSLVATPSEEETSYLGRIALPLPGPDIRSATIESIETPG
jgi:hypothetical protein